MDATEKLRNLILAPYIIKATALIGKRRVTGGNMFRHQIATMGIFLITNSLIITYYSKPLLSTTCSKILIPLRMKSEPLIIRQIR